MDKNSYAKVFESDELGQIIMMYSYSDTPDHNTMITLTFWSEDRGGVCTFKLYYKDMSKSEELYHCINANIAREMLEQLTEAADTDTLEELYEGGGVKWMN